MEISNLSVLEQEIINLMEIKKKNLTYKQIKRYLHINTEEKISEIENALENLEINGYLYLNDYDEYQLFEKCKDLAIGELKYKSNSKPYVLVGNSAIFIPYNHLNGAIPGDIVVIRRSNFKVQGNSRGQIEKILKRNGEIVYDYKDGVLKPYDWPVNVEVNLSNHDLDKIVNGSRILLKLSLEKTNNKYNGKIISLVGHKDDPQLDIKTIVANNGIKIDFSEESIKQADKINFRVTKKEIEKRIKNGGLDLRNKTIFTIDGENTKDIDDAVSIEKNKEGNYILGVHIADVSYYVEENSPLDLEARDRSTSVYPYNCVIPMLPHILSNGICSLNPNEDRLALSCIMEINKKGEIIDYKIVDTIINSKKKMSYDKINEIFEKNIVHTDYKDYLYELSLMIELSSILEKKKIERGYISFGDNEMEFVDENGYAREIYARKRGVAEKMIENFMLAANETVSSYYYWLETPGIYRDHPAPNVASIREIIALLGLNIHIPNSVTENPRILQNIMKKIQNSDEGNIYNEFLLLAMKRAYYSPYNVGHFGLALQNYTHFTSPIRRYPDLMTHRILRRTRDNILSIKHEELNKQLVEICKNASIKERIADKTEKEVNHYKATEYMENHVGEEFEGYIQYISKSGLSIRTEQYISGKINIDSMKEKNFTFNNNTLSLDNEDTKLFIGDKIKIKVLYANKETGKIDFEFIEKIEKNKVKKINNVI